MSDRTPSPLRPFPIPVAVIGPGSQAGPDERLNVLPLPQEMSTYRPPRLPEVIPPGARDAAVALLDDFAAGLERWLAGQGEAPVVRLGGLDPVVLALINDTLGQGEVSIRAQGGAGLANIDIQETIFAGLWRVQTRADDGGMEDDRLEAAKIPAIVIARARAATRCGPLRAETPAGLMNAPAVLAEINAAAQARSSAPDADTPAHVINLTLLPMSAEDMGWLGEVLGIGPVSILSRGYGNCRLTSTGLVDTWWVQYFNSSDALILNTLEITALPDAALAATEDLVDSLARLRTWTRTLLTI
ncbi:hydrogenase expression/formation protein [Betaproteobacteria bacterium]|nr:hydrogenase expression/formation protein [Betaproteobacteria bacterium]